LTIHQTIREPYIVENWVKPFSQAMIFSYDL